MKTHLMLLMVLFLGFTSCKKESIDKTNPPALQNGITYPDSILYGKNILTFPDSTVLSEGLVYEMGVNLENGATLKLIITNYPLIDTLTGHQTEWFYANETGWMITDFDNINNTQQFSSAQTGNIDLEIIFASYNQYGRCKIDFYENGNVITKVKHFSWH